MISSKRRSGCPRWCSTSNATALFGGPIFYEGETGLADLRRNFANDSGYHDYSTLRIDTFHQFLYPNTYFGWLSVVPRVGFRATYYDETRDLGNNDLHARATIRSFPTFLQMRPDRAGAKGRRDKLRTVFNAGVESSFKISRTWEDAQSRALGLDGLRHIIQPFTNFSWVSESSTRSRGDLAVRPLPALHAIAPDRFPAVHLDRFDRQLDDLARRACAIASKPAATIPPSAGWSSTPISR